MAKRSLTDVGTSKLARQVQGEESKAHTELPSLVGPNAAARPQPKSYRLTPADIARLRTTMARVSDAAGRPISETDLVKGLLLLGERTDAKKLLSAIKDAVFEDKLQIRRLYLLECVTFVVQVYLYMHYKCNAWALSAKPYIRALQVVTAAGAGRTRCLPVARKGTCDQKKVAVGEKDEGSVYLFSGGLFSIRSLLNKSYKRSATCTTNVVDFITSVMLVGCRTQTF